MARARGREYLGAEIDAATQAIRAEAALGSDPQGLTPTFDPKFYVCG